MIASERMLYIMNSLKSKGIINLKDIARELDISEITVRRDFEKLEKEGKLKRVQGGATRTGELEDLLDNADLPMNRRASLHRDEKYRVAERAAQFVKDGDCVFLDAGTSIAPLVDFLAERHVRIVTYNDLAVRHLKNPVAEIFVTGGQYNAYYSMYAGPMAQQALSQFRFDAAFFGVPGVDLAEGTAYTTETLSLTMKRTALENSVRRYLLLDGSKLERRGFLKLAELSVFDAILCEAGVKEKNLPENFLLV